MKHGTSLIAILLSINMCLPTVVNGAESSHKIRIGLPSLALTYMPFYVAQEKGFPQKGWSRSGIHPNEHGIQPQALVNGNINFFPSLATGISAAVAGLPLVMVLNFYTMTPWMLVTNKDINKPQDLIGKESRDLRHSHDGLLSDDRVVQKV